MAFLRQRLTYLSFVYHSTTSVEDSKKSASSLNTAISVSLIIQICPFLINLLFKIRDRLRFIDFRVVASKWKRNAFDSVDIEVDNWVPITHSKPQNWRSTFPSTNRRVSHLNSATHSFLPFWARLISRHSQGSDCTCSTSFLKTFSKQIMKFDRANQLTNTIRRQTLLQSS